MNNILLSVILKLKICNNKIGGNLPEYTIETSHRLSTGMSFVVI